MIQKASSRQERIRSHQPQLDKSVGGRKSPLSPRADKLRSKDKTPNKKKNEKFFKNAKESNVILTNESIKPTKDEPEITTITPSATILEKQEEPAQEHDFQAYLRSRCEEGE